MVFPLLFWVLVITGVVFIVSWMRERSQELEESSLNILKKRYASCEINQDTFGQVKKDIQRDKP